MTVIDLGWTSVNIVKNMRAKRMNIRYCNKLKAFKATLPKRGSQRAVEAFVMQSQDWMRSTLTKLESIERPKMQNSIMLMGEEFIISRDSSHLRIKLDAKAREIFMPVSLEDEHMAMNGVCRTYARHALRSLVEKWSGEAGAPFSKFSIADPKSRWGSCSSGGRIMLSWRLILAPPYVAEYVALHEVCHLIHLNHSKEFWALVKRHCPDYKTAVNWLKANGKGLF